MNGVFITGTNTGVGKTWIGTQLVKHLSEQGIFVIPQKPIESGCVLKDGKLFAEDANHYFQACKGSTPEALITPFRFSQVCSPARASLLSKSPLGLKNITQHILKTITDKQFAVIEGAGGIYSPLTTDALNIDLAITLNLPLVLVAEDTLGCINSILLSLKAIEDAKLNCIAIVLNKLNDQETLDTDNADELKTYTQLPIFCNQFQKDNVIAELAQLITNYKLR